MRRVFNVLLNDTLVGHLTEGDDGHIVFRMTESYRRLSLRPVLSQSFEDDLYRSYRGKNYELPAFFANLTPEGHLRELIERSLALPHPDELALLESVGHDLPGAIIITPADTEFDAPYINGDGEEAPSPPDLEGGEMKLRFSLAGVQLKFSVLREPEKLTLPVHGQGGEWIVKLDSTRFPNLAENEYATLEWARGAGFNVPECYLQPVTSLDLPLRHYAAPNTNVFVIRRYDRDDGRRIHQEDFAQVVSLVPRLKYEHIKYEQCAALVLRIAGIDEYYEFIRRLAFVVASGNVDAHLKNWSFIYPDGIHAKLSPLYDQVSTLAWPELEPELSLKLAGVKQLVRVDEAAFARLAERAGADVAGTMSALHESLERISGAWHESDAQRIMPSKHIEALQSYWKRSPLLMGLV